MAKETAARREPIIVVMKLDVCLSGLEQPYTLLRKAKLDNGVYRMVKEVMIKDLAALRPGRRRDLYSSEEQLEAAD